MSHVIRVPRVVLENHLTRLLNRILDSRDEQYIDEPEKLSDKPFNDAKFSIVGGEDTAAVLLTLDYLIQNAGEVDIACFVGASEWDLTEFAEPVIAEWRRRWPIALPLSWLDALELTDEDPISWRMRRAAGIDVPPDVSVSGRAIREGLSVMGWRPARRGEQWQWLSHARRLFEVLGPADDVITAPAMTRLSFAWHVASYLERPEPVAKDLRGILDTVTDAWASDGHTQVAEALRLLDPEADPEGTTMRVRVAADRLGAERGRRRWLGSK